MVRDVASVETFTPAPYILYPYTVHCPYCTPGYLTPPPGWSDSVLIEIFVPFYYRIHLVIYHFPPPSCCFDDDTTTCPPVPGRPRGCSSNDTTSFCPFINS